MSEGRKRTGRGKQSHGKEGIGKWDGVDADWEVEEGAEEE